MMQALTALGEEARDAGIGARRLEQLDLAVAGGEQRGAHALIGDLRLADERQTERVAPEAIRLVEILHDDADVMDIGDHVRRHTLADGAAIFKGFRARAEPGRSAGQASLNSFLNWSHASGGTALTRAISSTWTGCSHADERRADSGRRADELERPLGIGLEPGEEFADDRRQVARELPLIDGCRGHDVDVEPPRRLHQAHRLPADRLVRR